MDQHDMGGQSTANNALQYDGNMANFDYSSKMMPDYSVNEAMMTEAMNAVQPNVIPNAYDYTFLSNDNYYSNPSLPQHHISMNPGLHSNESPYCLNSTAVGHPNDNSYANTSEPQLCIDTSADSTNLSTQHESSQYGLSSDVDIKNNFFTEEKHIIDNAYTGEQLSVNNNVNSSFSNEFSQIQNQAELYRNEVVPESMQTDDITAHQYSYINSAPNLENYTQESAVTELPIAASVDSEETSKIEHSLEVKEESKSDDVVSGIPHDERVTLPPAESYHEVSCAEVTKQENVVKEERNESETHSNVNDVEKVSLENEISSIQMCIRNGCANRAVNNPEWEQEFCSNDCVIIHCRNVFTAWVKGNEINSQ